jgi:hypothetical protein
MICGMNKLIFAVDLNQSRHDQGWDCVSNVNP